MVDLIKIFYNTKWSSNFINDSACSVLKFSSGKLPSEDAGQHNQG